jgi:hypothetical protein
MIMAQPLSEVHYSLYGFNATLSNSLKDVGIFVEQNDKLFW